MRADITMVQIHVPTREMLNDFKFRAYRNGYIDKPSANEAIKFLLQKEMHKKK